MPENLNLLPQNLQISKSLGKVLKTTKALGVISIVVFIISALGVGAFFIYSKITLTNLQTEVTKLKSQVKAMESSEQQLVLLKDRLAKITSIKSAPNATKNITNVDTLFVGLSPSSMMEMANISSNKMDISMSIASNEDISLFLKNIKDTDIFSKVDLSTFGYSPGVGYSIDVSLGNK